MSKLFPKVLSSLRSDGIGRREIAKDLLIQPRDFDGITFGLSVTEGVVAGDKPRGGSGEGDARPKLRIV